MQPQCPRAEGGEAPILAGAAQRVGRRADPHRRNDEPAESLGLNPEHLRFIHEAMGAVVAALIQPKEALMMGAGATRANLWVNLWWAVVLIPVLWLSTQGDGIRGPALAGALCAALTAYLSVRFLVKYFETNRLTPFAVYCTAAGAVCTVIFLAT